MADVRLRVLRGETEHGTKLSRVVINRHQQARREPHTSSIEGNRDDPTRLTFSDETLLCSRVVNVIFEMLISTMFCQIGRSINNNLRMYTQFIYRTYSSLIPLQGSPTGHLAIPTST